MIAVAMTAPGPGTFERLVQNLVAAVGPAAAVAFILALVVLWLYRDQTRRIAIVLDRTATANTALASAVSQLSEGLHQDQKQRTEQFALMVKLLARRGSMRTRASGRRER